MFLVLFFGGLLFVVSAIVIQCLPQSVRGLLPESKDDAVLPVRYLWAVLLAVLAFNVFAYDSDTVAIGTGLFVASVCIALFIALPPSKQTLFAWVCMGIGILAGLAQGFRANEFVQAVNVVTVFVAFASLLLIHSVERIEWNAPWFLRTVLFYPAVVFQRLPGAMRLLKPTKLSGMSMLLRVVGITVVVVIFFAAILSSADPIFALKIRVLQEEIVPRTLWSVVLACAVIIALAATFSHKYTYKPLHVTFLSWLEAAVPVGAVCILFGVFLWVQGTYLFADHESFKALDLTYAEYVRKGMIEVLIATFCAGLLSYVVSLKQRELAGSRETGILQAVNAVLVLELFLMLASALKRDWMYMEVYGLTRVRVVGEIFLAWLAIIVLLFAAFALWRRLQEKAVFAGAIAVSFCVVVYLNVFNMDARIAQAVPPAGQERDRFYMSLLSPDAVEEWGGVITESAAFFEHIRVKDELTPDERKIFVSMMRSLQEIAQKRDNLLYPPEPRLWTSFRWAEKRAVDLMGEQSAMYRDTLDCLNREIRDYRWLHGLELSVEISALEYDYVRPFVNGPMSYDSYIEGERVGTADSCIL